MRRSVRMRGLILVMLVTCLAMAPATVELDISHQFHPEDDSRGRAAQVHETLAGEVAVRLAVTRIDCRFMAREAEMRHSIDHVLARKKCAPLARPATW